MREKRERVIKTKSGWRKADQVKKIRIYMVVIVIALCVSVVAGGLVTVNLLFPRQTETASSSVPASSNPSDTLPVYDNSFCLVLVNSKNQLPESFTHQIKEYQGIAVDERIIPALEKMMKDAGQDGCDLKLISGYVSSEDQEKKYQEKVDELTGQGLSRVRAEDQAQSTIGRGGYNEAQTGLSVCFSTEQAQGAAFADTPEYTWLSTNSVKYGFVLRYPKNKVNVTNMEFDPSRFRYVGGENAAKMREYAMCLEEYYSYAAKQN